MFSTSVRDEIEKENNWRENQNVVIGSSLNPFPLETSRNAWVFLAI